MSYFGSGSRMVGDPGFFSTLGNIAKGVGRGLGILPPAIPASTPTPPYSPARFFQSPRSGGRVPQVGQVPVPGVTGQVQRFLPGGASGFMNCPKGYHPDKKTGTRCVKNRRMNYSNPRALSRATRRIEGFGRQVKRAQKAVRKASTAIGANPRRTSRPKVVVRESGPGSVRVN